MPVAAVIRAGNESVIRGSITAIFGSKRLEVKGIFTLFLYVQKIKKI